jgi:ABC-2 type transport system permease protein
MDNMPAMLWVEARKALRSRMPLWTTVGGLAMPLGIAFLLFVARNPQLSQKLGLIGAKANLLAFAGLDWPGYLALLGQLVAAGGFILFVLATSWVFGREFVDGTLKDLLAVPVGRTSIVTAKFGVTFAWCAWLAIVMIGACLALAAGLGLESGTAGSIWRGGARVLASAGLAILVVTPFALLASSGRGYLLPIGVAILALMFANLSAVIGWGEYFPWAIPGLFAQAQNSLPIASFWIVGLTGLLGYLATVAWWKSADQNR